MPDPLEPRERLAVDPENPTLVYCGRDANGAYRYVADFDSTVFGGTGDGDEERAATYVALASGVGAPGGEPRYAGMLPSGATVSGVKSAILEMQAAIWRAEPTTECVGQTWRDFAERCDVARMKAEAGPPLTSPDATASGGSHSPAMVVPCPARQALERLVAKWRDIDHGGFVGDTHENVLSLGYRTCARELEAALAAPGCAAGREE